MQKLIKNHHDLHAVLDLIYKTKSKDGLWILIQDIFGVEIPRERCCAAHCAPFDFVAETFFQEYRDIVAVANRTGGKTLNFSILDTLNSYYWPDCETAGAAAIEAQAIRRYGYFQLWIQRIPVFASQIVNSIRSQTNWINGSKNEILVATMSGVNAPHPQKLLLDEVELMKWQVLQEAFSMPASKGEIMGQTILTSTRKFAFGPMERLLAEAVERGLKVYTWCIWEVIEPYPHDDPELCAEIEELFPEMPESVKTKTGGYYKWRDLISLRRKMDDEVWESQWLCKSPQSDGLMYPQFSDEPYPKGNTAECWYDPSMDLYLFEDFGYGAGHPDVVLFVQPDWEARLLYIFDSMYNINMVSRDICRLVAERMHDWDIPVRERYDRWNFKQYIRGWIPDPAGQTEAEDRKRMGAPILPKVEDAQLYKIKNGAPILRKWFKERRIVIDPRNEQLIGELKTYHKKKLPDGTFSDEPEKKNDHGPDALRYGMVKLFPLEATSAHSVELDEKTKDHLAPFTKNLLNKTF
jgi:hypothetical protein